MVLVDCLRLRGMKAGGFWFHMAPSFIFDRCMHIFNHRPRASLVEDRTNRNESFVEGLREKSGCCVGYCATVEYTISYVHTANPAPKA